MLAAVLPENDGPTAVVPVEMCDRGLGERDGIEAKTVVLEQLRSALTILAEHEPDRVTTLGGECSVSAALFSYLVDKYGDDLEILWIDSHPDMGTGESGCPGYHAMVVSGLTGHGDQGLLDILPATTIDRSVDVVALTIAEFIPRQVIHLQQIFDGFAAARRRQRAVLTRPTESV